MRALFVGGGSIGHIAPLLAVAEVLQARSAVQIHVLCTDQPDERAILEKHPLPFTALPFARTRLRQIGSIVTAFFRARRFLQSWKPDVVFSKGGTVSLPVCFAAHLQGIPIVLHESDAVMGRANRIVSTWASVICLGSISHRSPLTAHRSIFTGNPIRTSITQGNRAAGLRLTGFSGTRPILLVTGGSQGAQVFNDAIQKHLSTLTTFCDVAHLTGRGKEGAPPHPGYWSRALALDELADLYAIATVALSRAGEGNITELAANGIPMILVPLEGLAGNHQLANATRAQENGGCILLLQKHLEEKLPQVVREFLSDEANGAKKSACVASLHHPDAAVRIADILVQCVASHRRSH